MFRSPTNPLAAVLAALCLTQPAAGSAQDFPTRPVSIRVAYPAGGPADVAVREFVPVFPRDLGQPAVIENVPGANGSIAAMGVLQAAPDGHTLLGIVASDLLLAPKVIPTAKYKPDDFRPVAVTALSELVLVSSPAHSFKGVDDLVSFSKANTSKPLSIAHWGHGSITHVAGADFAERAGINLLQVPYKGAAPVIPEVANRSVDLTFYPLAGPLLGMIKAGMVRPVAIAASRRSAQLPDVPTISESKAVPSFTYSIWSGVFASRRVPEATIVRINKAISAHAATAEWRAKQVATGASPIDPMNVQQVDDFFKTEAANMEVASKILRETK